MRMRRSLASRQRAASASLHDADRPNPGHDSCARTLEGIEAVRRVLGHVSVAALATLTRRSLADPEALIAEYVRLGFRSTLVRPVSPFGFARRSARRLGYDAREFLAFHERALAHILDLGRVLLNPVLQNRSLMSASLRKRPNWCDAAKCRDGPHPDSCSARESRRLIAGILVIPDPRHHRIDVSIRRAPMAARLLDGVRSISSAESDAVSYPDSLKTVELNSTQPAAISLIFVEESGESPLAASSMHLRKNSAPSSGRP